MSMRVRAPASTRVSELHEGYACLTPHASHLIPYGTCLSPMHVRRYERPWLDSSSSDGDDSDATDDNIEWTEVRPAPALLPRREILSSDPLPQVNWARCDSCNKWRKLPCGPEYCAEALPELWYCSMNAETHANFCDEPEDVMEQVRARPDEDRSSRPEL